ncbi:MAG: arginine--tRNA ligase [Candidatus Lokiarchaeota archaeon]|nr:arginine--tRNA ligase [Candidatus Lokiarchaeota archaeon]
MSVNPWKSAFDEIVEILVKVTHLEAEEIRLSIEVPPNPKMGDLASTVAFTLAKKERNNPAEIAANLRKKLEEEVSKNPMIQRVETAGPYTNFFLDNGEFARLTLDSVRTTDNQYGMSDKYEGKRAMIESPAVNPSKPWHIGHARNAVLGDTLGRVLEAVGYDVVQLDYINDLGLQIAQLTWKLQKIEESETEEKYDHFLGKLYVEVQKEFEERADVEKEVRAISKQLEDRDSKASKDSLEMVLRCVKAQNETAYRLGIYKDYKILESTIAHSGLLDVAKEMMLKSDSIMKLEKGDKAGCIVAKLDTIEEFQEMKDPYKVLFRSDGTRTYTGADVAFQMWKFGIVHDPFKYVVLEEQPNGEIVYRTSFEGKDKNMGNVNLVFNVIGSAQSHPQRLIYTILHLLGYDREASNSHHVAYEFVGLEGADFSGRKGTWIGYTCDDILDKATNLALEEVEKRNPDETEDFKRKAAAQVGTGAVRYLLLKASPDRRITFRYEDALDFNGDAAPYLQYSHARAKRILEKAKHRPADELDYSKLASPHELALIKKIAKLPDVVLNVVEGMKKEVWGTTFQTNAIATYAFELANRFSKFYDECPVLQAPKQMRNARLALVSAFKITMANSLRLLGIPVVDKM